MHLSRRRRFWVEPRAEVIDPRTLASYMKFRSHTCRSLAKLLNVGHATIGHLRSGARGDCKLTLAKAIEEALNAPPGSLFVPAGSRVSQPVSGRQTVAA